MNPVVERAALETQDLGWGTLQWLANGTLFPSAEQTLGVCTLRPGASNPVHYHPNCEETLYVQQGQGKHLYDGEWYAMGPGSTIRVPRNMVHQLVNVGSDDLVCFIAFSSGARETVFLE